MPNYLDPLTAAELEANQEQAGLANYAAGFIPKFIAPIDMDPNIAIGFTLPFGTTITGPSFNVSYTTIEAVRNNLMNLLLTSKGERLSNPTFGSRLKFILFEQNDENIVTEITDAIQEAVDEWMPYVTILDVDVDRYNRTTTTGANVLATVVFSIADDAQSSAIGIPLTIADFINELGGSAQQNMEIAANEIQSGVI